MTTNLFKIYFEVNPIKSLITSPPAIINPATDGTKALLPGICLRGLSVSFEQIKS